jgi:hypothetical protein
VEDGVGLFQSALEHEIGEESLDVAFDGLDESAGLDAVEGRQLRADPYAPTARHVNLMPPTPTPTPTVDLAPTVA